METNDVELSVVIPCLDEAETIESCIRSATGSFEKMGVKGEVVVVDNGSSDRSADIASEAGAEVIRHSLKGYGSALKRGIREASGRYVIMGDGDATYDFSRLDEFVRRLRDGDELVMGSRLRGKIDRGAMPFLHRYVGTPVLTGLLNLFFKAGISDTNCGLRGFRKDAIEKLDLKCNGMEFASEMVIKAAQNGLKISEFAIDYHSTPRTRPPHLSTLRDGWRHLRFMLVLCPKYLFLLPGLVFFLCGLALWAALMSGHVVIFGIPMGLSAGMFAGALMFVGLQIALFGVLGMIFYSTTKLLKEDRLSRFLRRHFTLERGITVGGVIFAAGLGLGLVTIGMLAKIATTTGELSIAATRLAMIAIFTSLFGVQVVFFSFCLSLFDLNKTLEHAPEIEES